MIYISFKNRNAFTFLNLENKNSRGSKFFSERLLPNKWSIILCSNDHNKKTIIFKFNCLLDTNKFSMTFISLLSLARIWAVIVFYLLKWFISSVWTKIIIFRASVGSNATNNSFLRTQLKLQLPGSLTMVYSDLRSYKIAFTHLFYFSDSSDSN